MRPPAVYATALSKNSLLRDQGVPGPSLQLASAFSRTISARQPLPRLWLSYLILDAGTNVLRASSSKMSIPRGMII